MKGEDGGGQPGPLTARLLEQIPQQEGVGQVEQDVHEVIAERLQPQEMPLDPERRVDHRG